MNTHCYVFHRKQQDFFGSAPVIAKDFSAVALVTVEKPVDEHRLLEHAFELTNGGPNIAVTELFHEPSRSTSVGDVIVIDEKVFRCAMDGWDHCIDVDASDFLSLINPH